MSEFSDMLAILSDETKAEFPRITRLLQLCAAGGASVCEQMLPRTLAREAEQKELDADRTRYELRVRDYLLKHDLQKVSAQELGIPKAKIPSMSEIVTPEEALAHKIEKLFEKGGEDFLAFDEILWRLREIYEHTSSIYKLKACLHLTERPVALRKRLTFSLRFPGAKPDRTVWGIATNPNEDEVKNVPLSGRSLNEDKPVDSSLLLPRSDPRRRSLGDESTDSS
jgi:hypothetical protein